MSQALDRTRAALGLGRWDAAEWEVRGHLAHEPEDPAAHALLALALSGQERHKEAIVAAREFVRLLPETAAAHRLASDIELAGGRARPALAAALTATSLDPQDPKSWGALARAHQALGEQRLAVAAARTGLGRDPDDPGLHAVLSIALTDQNRRDEALHHAHSALGTAPEDAYAHYVHGAAALYAARDPRTAERSFREALRLDPSQDDYRFALIDAVKARSPFYRALPWVRHLRARPNRAFIVTRLGLALLFPMLWVFIAPITIGMWILWLTDVRHARTLAPLRGAAAARGTRLSTAALACGAVFAVSAVLLARPDLIVTAIACAALVTPIQEAHQHELRGMRAVLYVWTLLLTVVIALSPALGSGPAAAAAGASLLTVWPALMVRGRSYLPRPPLFPRWVLVVLIGFLTVTALSGIASLFD